VVPFFFFATYGRNPLLVFPPNPFQLIDQQNRDEYFMTTTIISRLKIKFKKPYLCLIKHRTYGKAEV
jgi:hypothetical protein